METYCPDNTRLPSKIQLGSKDRYKTRTPLFQMPIINEPQEREYNSELYYRTRYLFGYKNNTHDFIKLFEENPNFIEQIDNWGLTLMHRAAFHHDLDIIKYIYEKNPDLINVARGSGDGGSTPLYEAIHHGYKEEDIYNTVELLLNLGADPNLVGTESNTDTYSGNSYKGDTPLNIALRKGYLDIVALLLRRFNKIALNIVTITKEDIEILNQALDLNQQRFQEGISNLPLDIRSSIRPYM